MLNFDNEMLRDKKDMMQQCFRTRKTMVNPIVDWSERDVWEFLHHYGCEANPLYQCGDHRIGCIGCPLSSAKGQRRDFARYPKYKENYIKAFDRMLIKRKERGKDTQWKSGEEVMKWWLGEDANQLTLFDEDELLDIMTEMGG